MIGALAIFIVTNFLTKWMMYWLSTSSRFAKNNGGFGLKARKKVEKEPLTLYSGGKSKKTLLTGGIVAAAIVCASVAGLVGFGVSGHLYNNADSYLKNGRIDIKTVDETYLDKQSFLDKLDEEGFDFEYSDVTFNRVSMTDEYDEEYYTTYISLRTPSRITDPEIINGLTNLMTNEDEEATVVVSGSVPAGISHNNNSFYLVLGLTALFAALYILVRYGLYISLASLASTVVSSLFAIMLAVLLRLPFNLYTGFGFLGAAFVISFVGVSVFARNRDILKDSKIKKPTREQRTDYLDQAARLSMPTVVGSFVALTILSVVGAAINPTQLVSAFIIFILTAAVGSFLVYALACPLYLVIRHHFKIKVSQRMTAFFNRLGSGFKKIFHLDGKKTPVINKNEPHETIVPGINDFR